MLSNGCFETIFASMTVNKNPKIAVSVMLFYVGITNFLTYIPYKNNDNLAAREKNVLEIIANGEKVGFRQGAADSYMYYYFLRQKGVDAYK